MTDAEHATTRDIETDGGLPVAFLADLKHGMQLNTGDNEAWGDYLGSVRVQTWKSYKSDLIDYHAWCAAKDSRQWNSSRTIASYVRYMAKHGMAFSTIKRRVAAIGKLCEGWILVDDTAYAATRDKQVHLALRAARQKLSTAQKQATPLTGERLIHVLLDIDTDTLAGKRDAALLLIGFYGALRVSELRQITKELIKIDNDSNLVLTLPSTKTGEEPEYVAIHHKPAARWCPVTNLKTWLEAIDLHQQPPLAHDDGIWRRITKGDTFHPQQAGISEHAIDQLIRRRTLQAGVPDDPNYGGYSSHSLRSGFITHAKNVGIEEAMIMGHTRHKSVTQMREYDRKAGLFVRNPTSLVAL